MTLQDQESDGFSKYYSKTESRQGKKASSFQISGPRTGYGSLNITEGLVSCQALLKKAKEYGVSMTVFLTAVFLCAIPVSYTHLDVYKRQVSLLMQALDGKNIPARTVFSGDIIQRETTNVF